MQIRWTKEEIDTAIDLAKQGLSAIQIAAQLKGRTKNAIIGLLHRRKVVMRMYQSKPYPTKLPRKRARKKPTDPVAATGQPYTPAPKAKPEDRVEELFVNNVIDVKYGSTTLIDAHRTQCKWIEADTGMIVCGEATVGTSAWCKEHYKRVFTPVSVAKAAAVEARRRREIEKWPERKRF